MLTRVKNLFGNLVIYGLGDVATQLINVLLLPIFTSYLSTEDYGVIMILVTIEAVTKVTFRWGVDTAFMRMYYDCADQAARQRLASTIFFFLLLVNGSLVVMGVLLSGWIDERFVGSSYKGLLVALTIVNTFVAGFYFIPYQVLRIGQQSKQYVVLTTTRTAGTIVARLVLVIGAGLGILGIVLADIVVTTVFTVIMLRWFVPLIRAVFSRAVLKEALGFGLPRVPHSVAQQVISVSDRWFLKAYNGLSDVGLYGIGATFGLALKLFLSAFESAWTPFFLAVMNERDAKRIYSTVSTYVVAVLVLLVAGLCALAPGVVFLATSRKFHEAARFQLAATVTAWIALGVMFQGLYLIGSIGLVIKKRTSFYPISTGAAAVVSVLANIVLIPRFGMLGAAWANVLAYATLAVLTSAFSWRVYPIQYEWSRLLRIAIAGAASYGAAVWAVPASMSPIVGILLRGAVTVPVYGLMLYATGFFHAGELRFLKEVRERAVRPRARGGGPPPADVEMAGEIVSPAPEPNAASLDVDAPAEDAPINPDSRGPRR